MRESKTGEILTQKLPSGIEKASYSDVKGPVSENSEYKGEYKSVRAKDMDEVDIDGGEMAMPDMPMPDTNIKIRSINIRPLDYGFVVEVGCQSFAIGAKEELISKLTAYITDPSATERLWRKGKIILNA